MIGLLKFHLLQVWRSKLLVMWTLFSFFVMYALVKILHSVTIQYQQAETLLGIREVTLALLYAQFSAAGMLATVYGIWTVPYLHEEARAPLTFSLPVNKLLFPLTYFVSFLLLMLIQGLGLVGVLAMQYGWSALFASEFPWRELGSGMLLSLIGLEVVVLWLAVVSLTFGKITAFLGSTAVILVLQVSGILFYAGWGKESLWKKVYVFLPPLGDVFMDFKNPLGEGQTAEHLVLWLIWLLIFGAAFRWRLQRA